MGVVKASCLLFLLSVLTVPVWADRPFVGLILYTLHKGNSYLLLANSQGAENIWAGFTADEEQSGDEALDSAIQDAVVASRCYFSFTQIRRSVDSVHFQEPWHVPRYVAYFAQVPRIRPQELEDD